MLSPIPIRIVESSFDSRPLFLWALLLVAAAAPAHGAPEQVGEASRFGTQAGPLVTIPPAVGLRFGGDNSRVTLALPWSIQFGPLVQRDSGEGLRPYRALLEPGLVFPSGNVPTSYFLRMGLRRMANITGILGFGLGLGYTQSLSKSLTSALSQEVLITFGRCCSPGFAMLSVRYEYSFSAQGEVWTSLGFALW